MPRHPATHAKKDPAAEAVGSLSCPEGDLNPHAR